MAVAKILIRTPATSIWVGAKFAVVACIIANVLSEL
jgi:hypothetical protein